VRARPTFFAARESVAGPSLHSPQCSIIPAIEAKAVTVSPPGHDSDPLDRTRLVAPVIENDGNF
jgi:hypothetical protein